MFFIFVAQINVIFMRPFYEAIILCDCINNIILIDINKERKRKIKCVLSVGFEPANVQMSSHANFHRGANVSGGIVR